MTEPKEDEDRLGHFIQIELSCMNADTYNECYSALMSFKTQKIIENELLGEFEGFEIDTNYDDKTVIVRIYFNWHMGSKYRPVYRMFPKDLRTALQKVDN